MKIWQNRNWQPMLLKEIDKPFDSDDYIYEIKYDGIRAICFVGDGEITFMSRNNYDMTEKYPELKNIKNITKEKTIFDGEIIAVDNFGKPSFELLQERMHLKDKKKICSMAKENPVIYVVFDILYKGLDITNLPLIKRKQILNNYKDTEQFVKALYIESDGIKFFKEIKKRNLEGIVAKLKNGTYHINKRTYDFIKIKNFKEKEFTIFGYKFNKQKLSLYLGLEKGKNIEFIGKCSISRNNPNADEILNARKSKNKVIDINEEIIFIEPNLKCIVQYTEMTKNKSLRHPIFKNLKHRNEE